jgi:hypothetical protein
MTRKFVDLRTQAAPLQLRHHLECLPRRHTPKPRWEPPLKSDAPDIGNLAVASNPRLVVAHDLGPVRINFRYAGHQGVMSAHSEKAQRTQYFEGNHEAYGFRLHEMDPSYVDLQYQPAALSWTSLDKKSHRVVFDYAVEMADGQIIFGEDKASQAFFLDTNTKARLDLAEAVLGQYGVKLERRVAGGLPSALKRRVVKEHFDARRTSFSEQDVNLVQYVIHANGGAAPLSSLLTAMGNCPSLGLQKLSAMMLRRKLSMPLDQPPMPSTVVTIPVKAERGALRAFLGSLVSEPTDKPIGRA